MSKKFAASIAIAVMAIMPHAVFAKGVYQAKEGETPLETKCHSEAFLIGAGGKGATQRALNNKELRREHFKKCMAGG